MIIEISGAGFNNKGGQLMLWTVAQRLRAHLPGVLLCVEVRDDRPYEARAGYGLYTLLPYPVWRHRPVGRLWRTGLDRLLRGRFARSARQYGLVSRHQCDALIDISGYAFGDKWPLHKTLTFAERARFYQRRGKPVIMLSQMFGPFTAPDYADAFARMMSSVTLAFARESVSYEHAVSVGVPPSKLALAPDLTISTPGSALQATEPEPYACLVPNIRMLDQGRQTWGHRYLRLLEEAARKCLDRGLQVRVVVHEAEGRDQELVEALVRSVNSPRCIPYQEPDPLQLKSYLAGAVLLVGSRFHSIVGAFSSGVPTVIMGWAHKYELLAADFDVPELVLRPEHSDGHFHTLLERLLDPAAREVLVSKLVNAKASLMVASEQMWARTWDTLGVTDAPPVCVPSAS